MQHVLRGYEFGRQVSDGLHTQKPVKFPESELGYFCLQTVPSEEQSDFDPTVHFTGTSTDGAHAIIGSFENNERPLRETMVYTTFPLQSEDHT